jgi:thiosulfate dehydrogenase [quinone] large subunit
MGWIFTYAGLSKIFNPEWSAAGFLNNANSFPKLFAWLASQEILPITNLLNEWGLTLVGISLLLGAYVKLSSKFAILLMTLYYLAPLKFPYPNDHSLIIDDHIIYILVFIILITYDAGKFCGLDERLKK